MSCVSIYEQQNMMKIDEKEKLQRLSILLSGVETIKNTANLMLFSARSRLHIMNEAFLRAMSGKVFVGRSWQEKQIKIFASYSMISMINQCNGC